MKNLYNIILFSVLFIILSFKSWSLPICNDNDDVWNNCFGTYEHTEGDAKGEIIKGEFLNNYLNGYGAIYYNDGSIYKGNLKNNIANGLGFETYTGEYKGHAYIGEFLNGKRHGKGVYFYSDGKTEIGIFKNGYYSNSQNCPKNNTIEWDNCYGYYQHNEGDHKGESYEGWFKNDEYHGIGIYRYNNGDSYSGEFKNGDFDGYGVFEYANGKKDDGIHKKGEFQHTLDLDTQIDKPKIVENYNSNKTCPEDVNVVWDNCFTVYSFPKGHESYGDRYEGMIKNDEWHGQGTYYYSNGDKYVGEFKEGKAEGLGTFFYLADNVHKGDKYVGQYQNDERHGQGTYYFADGRIEKGDFKNGKLNGYAISYNADGSVDKQGIWKDDEFLSSESQNNNNKKSVNKKNNENILNAASGTGFAISSDGYVVTNYHVIDGCQSVKIHLNGKVIPSSIIKFDPQNDIALLKGNFTPAYALPLSNEETELLEDIFVAGFPFGNKISTAIKVTKGIVSSLTGIGNNFSNFQIDAALQPGNSGGPILNNKGNVIGVAVAKLDRKYIEKNFGVIPENTNFGIKTSVVKSMINSSEINLAQPNKNAKSTKELGRNISNSTYYLSCWMTSAQIEKMQSKKVIFKNLIN
jgi:hypothetical protein